MNILKLEITAIVFVALALLYTSNVEAKEGLYLMMGYGAANSELPLYDDEDEACQFGMGYSVGYRQLTFDFAYRNKFLCEADIDDESGDIETFTIDMYWYPFQS